MSPADYAARHRRRRTLGFTAILSSFSIYVSILFLLFSSATFRACWTALNQTGHMLGSNWDLKMHVRNMEYPIPLKIEGFETIFWRLRNLMATLTAYIFGMTSDIHNRASAFDTTRGVLHCLKITWSLAHKRLILNWTFYPSSVYSAVYLIARLRRRRSAYRNSTKLRQTVDSKSH